MTKTDSSFHYKRSHPWLTFTVDLTKAPVSFWTTLGECCSKCEHIAGVPLRPDVAQRLHEVYLAKGIGGTTAIEGNTLSEAEVLKHVEGRLELPPSKEYLKQEIDNILQEQNAMLHRIRDHQSLTLSMSRLKEINRIVLRGLELEKTVIPGEIRTYSVGVMTYRGAPWQECEYLVGKLCSWLNGGDFEPQMGLNAGHMAILKAIVAHLYIEWIHPFGDGNGRTGRLVEVQILLASGIAAPACQLLSNHYNQTRKTYLAQLKAASESGGDVLPFICYAMQGFVEGLRDQLRYIRKLQMDVSWSNYVHEIFGKENTKAADRQKHLLLDVFEVGEAIDIAKVETLSPRLAKEYAGKHPRTCLRDIEQLEKRSFLVRDGRTIRANTALIAQFLPTRADPPETSAPIELELPFEQSPDVETAKAF